MNTSHPITKSIYAIISCCQMFLIAARQRHLSIYVWADTDDGTEVTDAKTNEALQCRERQRGTVTFIMSKKYIFFKLTILHPCCITPLLIYINVTKNVAILWYLHMIYRSVSIWEIYHYKLLENIFCYIWLNLTFSISSLSGRFWVSIYVKMLLEW